MSTTHTAAWNELCAAARAVLNGPDVLALVGYAPELRYPDVVYAKRPNNMKVFCRISLAQAGQKNRTLNRPSRVTYQGVVDIQSFAPVSDPKVAEVSVKLAELLQRGLTKSTANVDLYMAAIRDMQQEETWVYKRITATYNYDVME